MDELYFILSLIYPTNSVKALLTILTTLHYIRLTAFFPGQPG